MDRLSYWEEMKGHSRKVARKYAIIFYAGYVEKRQGTQEARGL